MIRLTNGAPAYTLSETRLPSAEINPRYVWTCILLDSANVEGVVLYELLLDPKCCPPYSLKLAMMSAYWKLDEELCPSCGEKAPAGFFTLQ